MLKLSGARGFLIATVGSMMPISIGIAIATVIGADTASAIAAGATFGPTSFGIALNILRGGGVLNTCVCCGVVGCCHYSLYCIIHSQTNLSPTIRNDSPVGQLIISAAVIDDMIALIVLSMLKTLGREISVASILIPIVSALGFLFIGGYLAIFVAPQFMHRFLLGRVDKRYHSKIELAILFGLALALMPATYYAQASFLMGAFLAGLAFCSSHGLQVLFVSQFKRILSWLMRIFFAASIGYVLIGLCKIKAIERR